MNSNDEVIDDDGNMITLEGIDAKMKRGMPGTVTPEEIAALVEYVKAAESEFLELGMFWTEDCDMYKARKKLGCAF